MAGDKLLSLCIFLLALLHPLNIIGQDLNFVSPHKPAPRWILQTTTMYSSYSPCFHGSLKDLAKLNAFDRRVSTATWVRLSGTFGSLELSSTLRFDKWVDQIGFDWKTSLRPADRLQLSIKVFGPFIPRPWIPVSQRRNASEVSPYQLKGVLFLHSTN